MAAATNILALETSTEHLSVAVMSGEAVFARDCVAGQKHSELLLPMIASVLIDACLRQQNLHVIAFGAGPGSFTGLRIACGVAQGLGFGLDIPLIPVSSLEAIAEGTGAERVVVAVDARMGEIYHAAFERAGGRWTTLVEANLCKPEQAPALMGVGWFAAGSGFAAYGGALRTRYQSQIDECRDDAIPHAAAIARLARERWRRGLTVPARLAAPLYVRDKVALTVAEQGALR